VITTTVLTPESSASNTASFANFAGTKISDVLALVLQTASETSLKTGTP